jgi:hypothetical protein
MKKKNMKEEKKKETAIGNVSSQIAISSGISTSSERSDDSANPVTPPSDKLIENAVSSGDREPQEVAMDGISAGVDAHVSSQKAPENSRNQDYSENQENSDLGDQSESTAEQKTSEQMASENIISEKTDSEKSKSEKTGSEDLSSQDIVSPNIDLEGFYSENISSEDREAMKQLLTTITDEITRGALSARTLECLSHALHYERDIALAAHEGEVKGRNAKIEEFLIERRSDADMHQVQTSIGQQPSAPPYHIMGGLTAADRLSIWERGRERRVRHDH